MWSGSGVGGVVVSLSVEIVYIYPPNKNLSWVASRSKLYLLPAFSIYLTRR